MSDESDLDLERTAGAVADQAPLDWSTEETRRPELHDALAGLQTLERLAAAHRSARQRLGTEIAAAPDRRDFADEPALATPVFSWGFLRALERVGTGGFGEVWRAWDPTLEREVALKLRRLAPVAPGGTRLARTSDPATRP